MRVAFRWSAERVDNQDSNREYNYWNLVCERLLVPALGSVLSEIPEIRQGDRLVVTGGEHPDVAIGVAPLEITIFWHEQRELRPLGRQVKQAIVRWLNNNGYEVNGTASVIVVHAVDL